METSATLHNLRIKDNQLIRFYNINIKSFILTVLFLCPIISYGQKSAAANSGGELTPSRGIYKTFASLNPKPQSAGQNIDKLKFPFDQAWADKVLSIKPVYLKNISANDFKLPEPPANSSDQTRAELNYLLTLQHNRSLEDITTSLYMSNNPESPSDIGQAIGYWIEPQKLPLTDCLMENVEKDGDFFLWSLKFKYARVRPYIIEPKIHDLEESRASSYPSGHVTYAYIRAFIYQELAPEFTDFFIANAYNMSRARQIIGVHYPSDCEGSRIFAREFVNKLLANEKFRQDLENVKKEWASKMKVSFNNTVGALGK
jgi:acid phosphatase (class A)